RVLSDLWYPLYRLSLVKYRLCRYRRGARWLGNSYRCLRGHLDGCVHSCCSGLFFPVTPSTGQHGKRITKKSLASLDSLDSGLCFEYPWPFPTRDPLVYAHWRSILCAPDTRQCSSINEIRPRAI